MLEGRMTAPARYFPVVAFDLDGTLLRRTTVALLLAGHLGQAETLHELERAFVAGEISSRDIADASAAGLAGRTTSEIASLLAAASWIGGIDETLRTLAKAGSHVLLATITWRFAAEVLQERHGFAAVSGTELTVVDGVLGGEVRRYFEEHDKLRFVEQWCAVRGIALADVAAVGDSRLDLPLFRRAGRSVALNATPDARRAATCAIDTEDLRDVLPLLTR
jgi:phosphoserine phosphatase